MRHQAIDQEIVKKLRRLNLKDEEDESILLEEEDICHGVEECLSSCFRQIFYHKEYPLRVLRLLLKNVWKVESVRVVKIQVNVVQIFFQDEEVIEKILKGGPLF